MPTTIIMFTCPAASARWPTAHGPRLFMGVGPLVAAVGILLLLRVDADVDYVTDVLPGGARVLPRPWRRSRR